MSVAALRLPARLGIAVAAIAGAALAVAWAVNGNHPVTGVVLNEIGVAAFFVLATFARRLRDANERSQRLVVELEASRAAQAEAAALGERQRLAREMRSEGGICADDPGLARTRRRHGCARRPRPHSTGLAGSSGEVRGPRCGSRRVE